MSTEFALGDQVEITIKGEVASEDAVYDVCHKIEDGNGTYHYVYLPAVADSASGVEVKVTRKAETFESRKPYQDADGDVFIRRPDGWVDAYGTQRRDSFPTRPMKPLTVETTVTETQLRDAFMRVIRTRGGFEGRISAMSVPSLVEAVKGLGVKVAK